MPKRQVHLKRFTSIGSAIDTLRNRRLAFVNPDKWDDRNDAEFMRLYRNRSGREGLKALCCTESSETYHHWKVFTQPADGCFIELDRRQLLDSIRADARYRANAVDYIHLNEIEDCDYDIASLPFLKGAGFGPEQEFRVIFEGACDEEVHFLTIDLAWIKRIVLNPWIAPTIFDSVAETFREISGNPELDVVASSLTNSQTWLRWGRSISRRGV
ncbi:hypothetical protein ASG29_06650 [Sphingomonas sp. Leaf412]|uniref:hypothetical protein n=1 Tax=Sphingomonas sp. Leaf412 TaxID=1736370 RepID=UPI0006F46D0D|nr:hypothetical protein [Sphingomonas sp. Leaf412]KQT33686.1 hypothetical protein ASG29_06650 [Sphingomonas sp. Leaf412]